MFSRACNEVLPWSRPSARVNSGTVIWKYEPRQDPSVIPVMCCDTVNRGVYYSDGKIFLHQADTTLVALDAATGKELWTSGTTITSFVHGVGPSAGDGQVYVVTYDGTLYAFGFNDERRATNP